MTVSLRNCCRLDICLEQMVFSQQLSPSKVTSSPIKCWKDLTIQGEYEITYLLESTHDSISSEISWP